MNEKEFNKRKDNKKEKNRSSCCISIFFASPFYNLDLLYCLVMMGLITSW